MNDDAANGHPRCGDMPDCALDHWAEREDEVTQVTRLLDDMVATVREARDAVREKSAAVVDLQGTARKSGSREVRKRLTPQAFAAATPKK